MGTTRRASLRLKGVVDELKKEPPAPGTPDTVWDEEIKGFGIRFRGPDPAWILMYRFKGRKRRLYLGKVGALTPTEARTQAQAALGDVAKGEDPAAAKVEERRKAQGTGTVRGLVEEFLASGQGAKAGKLSPGTRRQYRYSCEHVLKALGPRRLDEIRRRDVMALRAAAAEAGPAAANRAVRALSAAWTWGQHTGAVDEDLVLPSVPALAENRNRGSALTPDELGRLGAALKPYEGPEADAMRVYLLSGCRPSEVLALRWEDVHEDGRRLKLPTAKTGPRTVFLGTVPADVVARQPVGEPGGYIFASRHARNRGGRLYSLSNLWRKLSAEAKLDTSIRLYDAGRHTYCSRADDLGYAEHLVRKLTGHAKADSGGAHSRYRHPSPERLLNAAEDVSASLWKDYAGSKS